MGEVPTDPLVEELAGLYRAWFSTISEEGTGDLDTILDDAWVYSNYDGVVRGKRDYLDHVGSVVEDVRLVGPTEMQVRRHGPVVLVVGAYGVEQPDGATVALRFTGAWEEVGGRWRCVAHHNSVVAHPG